MLFLRIIRICAIDRRKEHFYRHYEWLRDIDRIEKQAVKLGPNDIGQLQQAVKPTRIFYGCVQNFGAFRVSFEIFAGRERGHERAEKAGGLFS